MGRPSSYSEEIADAICEKMAEGMPVIKICKLDGFPSQSMVYRWLEAHVGFREKYARAREKQADYLAEETVAIADEQCEVVREDGGTFDPDVNRDRLRIDARKWFASKVAPKKYGEKITHAGDAANPLALMLGQMQKSPLPVAPDDGD